MNFDLPNNEAAYIKRVVTDTQVICYLCYPSQPAILLTDEKWRIVKQTSFLDANNNWTSIEVKYPFGNSNYNFAASDAEVYDYEFSNI